MEFRRLTATRGVLAVITTAIEEAGIWAIWRFVLPEFNIHWPVSTLIGAMSAWFCFSIWLFTFTTFALKKQKPAGAPTMIGTLGKAASDLAPTGMVRIKSELWSAVAVDGDINPGENIIVVGEDRMKLEVRRNVPEVPKR